MLPACFDEAVRGATLPLSLSGPATCRTCHGSGAKPGTALHTCPVCGGAGMVTVNQGGFGFSEPCRECRGRGQVPDTACPECRGSGTSNQTRTITVRVPAGVKDGAKLRIAGKGTPGQAKAQASVCNAITAVLEAAGLAEEPDVRPASVRNWAGRRLFDGGMPIERVARRLGARTLDAAAEDIALEWR